MHGIYIDLLSPPEDKSISKQAILRQIRDNGLTPVSRNCRNFARPTIIREEIHRASTVPILWVETPAFVERGRVWIYPKLGPNKIKLDLENLHEQIDNPKIGYALIVLHCDENDLVSISNIARDIFSKNSKSGLLIIGAKEGNFRDTGIPIHIYSILSFLELAKNFESNYMLGAKEIISGLQSHFPDVYDTAGTTSSISNRTWFQKNKLKHIPQEFIQNIESDDLGQVQDDIQELAHYLFDDQNLLAQMEALCVLLSASYKSEFVSKISLATLIMETSSIQECYTYSFIAAENSVTNLEIETVLIPKGATIIGVNDPAYPAENPQHTIDHDEYQIGKYLVTQSQFCAFLDSTQHEFDISLWKDHKKSRGELPANFVTLIDAIAFCNWVTTIWRISGKLDNSSYITLPSEVEWERAARGPDQTHYPWGDTFEPDLCNCKEFGLDTISDVSKFTNGKSKEGVFDLIGNIHEWTRSSWGYGNRNPEFPYPYDPEDGRERINIQRRMRYIVRGGAFYYERHCLNAFSRNYKYPDIAQVGSGFRVCIKKK